MKRLLTGVFLGALLGGAATYVAFSFYIVRADGEWLVVRKPRAALTGTYVDIRAWNAAEWTQNPDVARALIKDDRRDLLKPLNPGQVLEDLLHGFEQAGRNRNQNQRR